MDQLVASGVDPKTADAIKKFVETAIENSVETAVKSSVETAVRSLGIADQSRQQETARLPASKESIGWTGIIAIAAVFSIQLGAIYWLNNNMQAGFESVNEEFGRVYEEFGRVRDEISDLRNHTLAEISDLRNHTLAEIGSIRAEIGSIRAEIGLLRSEVGELGERMTRLEMLTQDRLPSAP